jgi:ABC-2 type transport system permease protein
MSNIWIVVKREFLTRVQTRAFVIGTVAFPLLMTLMIAGPAMLAGGRHVKLALVNEAGPAVGQTFQQLLTAPSGDEDANTYELIATAGGLEQNRETLNRQVRDKELDGYVVLPANLVATSKMGYRGRNISNFELERDIRRAASQAVQAERLGAAGLRAGDVQALLRPVEVEAARVTKTGEEAGDARSSFFLGYIVGFLVYMLTLLYGINVLRSVLEEKTNRIVEVIISSMRAEELMVGKVLGVASVALLQVAIWIGMGVLTGRASFASRLGIPARAMSVAGVSPWLVLGVVGFFVFGFLLYSGLFAALGAAVTSEQEAQQLQIVVMAPLIGSLLSMVAVIGDPLGRFSTVLGMIPFSAPVVMPMRMATAAVPPGQIVASLAILLASVLVVTWLAGKIYRVGILSTGHRQEAVAPRADPLDARRLRSPSLQLIGPTSVTGCGPEKLLDRINRINKKNQAFTIPNSVNPANSVNSVQRFCCSCTAATGRKPGSRAGSPRSRSASPPSC